MPALLGPNGPRAPDVVRPRQNFIVLAFPGGVSNGMDRRKIQDVETHRGDVRKTRFAVTQCSISTLLRCARSGEHLIPSGKTGLLPVDSKTEFLAISHGEAAISVALKKGCDFSGESRTLGAAFFSILAQDAGEIAKSGGVLGASLPRCGVDQIGADPIFRAEPIFRLRTNASGHSVPPGLEPVNPAFHRVIVFPDF